MTTDGAPDLERGGAAGDQGPPVPAASGAGDPVAPPRRRRTRARHVLVAAVLAAVITAGLLRVLWVILAANGLLAVLVGATLALLPVLLVAAAFLWLDRFETEPPGLLLLALGWGAGVATAVALAINSSVAQALYGNGEPGWISLAVVAPVVEETAKALGLVAVLVLRRREIDGLVDGIVYAGMVGIGFAFVENILYFSSALVGGGTAEVAVVFVLRAVLSPFAHPLFTMAVGVGIGLALRRRGRLRWLLPVVGLLVAIALHALWNGSTFILDDSTSFPLGFFAVYVLLQLPVFVGAVVLAVLARRRESRVVRANLEVYAGAGWLTPAEVWMLSSLPERRRARRWARASGGGPAEEAMRDFQDLASELAFWRERRRTSSPHDAVEVEAAMLRGLWARRADFVTPVVPRQWSPTPVDAA